MSFCVYVKKKETFLKTFSLSFVISFNYYKNFGDIMEESRNYFE